MIAHLLQSPPVDVLPCSARRAGVAAAQAALGWQREWQLAVGPMGTPHGGVYGGCVAERRAGASGREGVAAPPPTAAVTLPAEPQLPAEASSSGAPSAAPQQAQPQPPAAAAVRLYAEWSGDSASLWLALDRRAVPYSRAIASRIRDWMATQGFSVQSLTCNGTPVADARDTKEPGEENP